VLYGVGNGFIHGKDNVINIVGTNTVEPFPHCAPKRRERSGVGSQVQAKRLKHMDHDIRANLDMASLSICRVDSQECHGGEQLPLRSVGLPEGRRQASVEIERAGSPGGKRVRQYASNPNVHGSRPERRPTRIIDQVIGKER
jgi:hypothetical protein